MYKVDATTTIRQASGETMSGFIFITVLLLLSGIVLKKVSVRDAFDLDLN